MVTKPRTCPCGATFTPPHGDLVRSCPPCKAAAIARRKAIQNENAKRWNREHPQRMRVNGRASKKRAKLRHLRAIISLEAPHGG